MDKELREIAVSTVFSLLYITIGIIMTAVALTDTVRHVVTIRNNLLVEGTVLGMTSETVRVRRSHKKVYTISFLYEYEGQECKGSFKTSVPAPDFFKRGESIERRYRTGNRMSVLLAPDWSLVVYSERKSVLANDALNLLFCCVMLVVALCMLYRQLDAVWDRKGKPGPSPSAGSTAAVGM